MNPLGAGRRPPTADCRLPTADSSLPLASLSLDLDNKWSYLKTHGDRGWEGFPSYLDVVVPRFLEVLRSLELRITVFVVGQDAALEKNHAAVRAIAAAGHELGNHSFRHEPWLHLFSESEIEDEIRATEDLLERIGGRRPLGFRGPGFSLSPAVLRVLARRGYLYDATTLPTFLGPLARAYYFLSTRLSREERTQRKLLFGRFSEGFRPVAPHGCRIGDRHLIEIPVTTVPLVRVPMHVSYLMYLAQFSALLALSYFRVALTLCQAAGVEPSLLLHPLDFLGMEDAPELAFFPAMRMPTQAKLRLVRRVLGTFAGRYRVVPLEEHARHVALRWRGQRR